MKELKELLYVGIDVDDKSFHGTGFCKRTGQILEFKCKPTKCTKISAQTLLNDPGTIYIIIKV